MNSGGYIQDTCYPIDKILRVDRFKKFMFLFLFLHMYIFYNVLFIFMPEFIYLTVTAFLDNFI